MTAPTIYSYTIKDAKGVSATASFYVTYNPSTITFAELTSGLDALGSLVEAITDGVIVNSRVILQVDPNVAWKDNAVANCDVEESEVFDFNVANSPYLQSVVVPAIKQDLLVGGGKVNLSSAGAIKSFADAVVGSFGTNNAISVIAKFGGDLTSVRQAYKSPRRRARAAKQRTLSTP